MRTTRNRVFGAALLAFALLAAACGGDDEPGGDVKDGPEVIIGSFGFAESEIMGEIYRLALEADGYRVSHRVQLGAREAIVNPALRSGEINFVPEYVGSGLEVTFKVEPTADSAATRDALRAEWEKEGFTVLDFTPAQDKNGIVVTSATAQELGLSTISDLKEHAADLTLGGPSECPQRPRCIPGLESVYGLTFAEFKPLDSGGTLTVEALAGGEIDVALLFTSDGVIEARDFVLLEDDLGLQPAENIAPVVSQELVDEYGDDFVNLVDRVSTLISQEDLTRMNKEVGYDGESATDVARAWLETNGFV